MNTLRIFAIGILAVVARRLPVGNLQPASDGGAATGY
jgi:hypothetical protein